MLPLHALLLASNKDSNSCTFSLSIQVDNAPGHEAAILCVVQKQHRHQRRLRRARSMDDVLTTEGNFHGYNDDDDDDNITLTTSKSYPPRGLCRNQSMPPSSSWRKGSRRRPPSKQKHQQPVDRWDSSGGMDLRTSLRQKQPLIKDQSQPLVPAKIAATITCHSIINNNHNHNPAMNDNKNHGYCMDKLRGDLPPVLPRGTQGSSSMTTPSRRPFSHHQARPRSKNARMPIRSASA